MGISVLGFAKYLSAKEKGVIAVFFRGRGAPHSVPGMKARGTM